MYNDYQLADNLSAKAMRQRFGSIQTQEMRDIHEIYEKIRLQRDFLKSNNIDGKYDKIITKMDESMSELDGIISTTKGEKSTYKASNLMELLARQKGNGRALEIGNLPTENDDTIDIDNATIDDAQHSNNGENTSNSSPMEGGLNDGSNGTSASAEPNQNPENGDSDTTADEIPPQNDDATTGTNNETKPQNTYKRNFPMPGSILFRLSQSLFVNTRHKQGKAPHSSHNMHTNSTLASYQKSPHSPQNVPMYGQMHEPPYDTQINPPHTPQYPHARPYDQPMNERSRHSHCDSQEQCVTNQLDLLRLMLLFMTLRPNCRYLPRICRIASTQLDVLSEMMM